MSKSNRTYENKTISVNSHGIIISYTDNNKHSFIRHSKENRLRSMPARYQEFEKPVFNQKQERIFLEAMYGISIYSEDVLQRMPKNVIMRIITRSEIVQKILNKWKQEIVNQRIDTLLTKVFPMSPIVKQLIGMGTDDTVICNIPNKDLGISERMIAEKLLSLKLLPQNFFQLQ